MILILNNIFNGIIHFLYVKLRYYLGKKIFEDKSERFNKNCMSLCRRTQSLSSSKYVHVYRGRYQQEKAQYLDADAVLQSCYHLSRRIHIVYVKKTILLFGKSICTIHCIIFTYANILTMYDILYNIIYFCYEKISIPYQKHVYPHAVSFTVMNG